MAWKGYHFRLPTSVNVHYDFFMALKAFIVAAGWELYDSFGLTKAIWTLTTTSTFTDAETISIDGKVYTIKTTLTPTEGQVLRGGSASITLDNLKSAINHTGTPGTDYSCAAAHPTVTATTKTATSLVIQAIADGDANNTNSMAVTETCNQASFAQTAVQITRGIRVRTLWIYLPCPDDHHYSLCLSVLEFWHSYRDQSGYHGICW
jgi:hypothetical protein